MTHLPWPHGPVLWLAGAGAVVLIAGAVSSWRRRRSPGAKSRRAGRGAESPPPARPREPAPEQRELARELSQMVRRASRALEAQSSRLQKLIDEADQRITKLQAMQPKAGQAADGAKASDGIMISLADGPDAEAEHPADPQAQTAALRHAQVYAYHDQGLSAGEIAEAMGRPAGEIELILALRPQASSASPQNAA